MNYMNNVWKLYAISFFQNLIPAYVIERLFFQQRGMTIQMVVYTEIIYALTVVFLEIPTGIIADKWGRKRMLVLNAFLSCCELVILIFATSFWHFAAAIFLAGIGRSAASGSGNALLYDSLLQSGDAKDFEMHLGRLNAFDFSAAILAALSGSLLAGRFGFEFNYWLSFASMLISLCVTLVLAEPEIKSASGETILACEYLQASMKFFVKNPNVCLVLFSGMVSGAAINFIDEFWQLYLNRLGVPVAFFGLFSAGCILFRLPGSMMAYKLKTRFSYRALISVVIFIITAGFFYITFVKSITSLLVIFLICIAAGVIDPLAAGYLHHRIDSSMRATIDSFQSLGLKAVTIVAGLGFGFFSARFDVFGGYGFIALLCSVYLFCYMVLSKKADNI